ncbi:MAG: amidohydrolase family protein [Salinirussus sp.]
MASADAERALTLEDLTIVDADSHLKPTPEDLLEYMEPTDGARRMIEKAGQIGSEIFTHTRASAAFPNDSDNVADGTDPVTNRGYQPDGKAEYMDEFGISAAILTPAGGTAGGGIATINHDPTAVSYATAYNDWLVDNWLGVDERFHGSILVANQRPDLAAEEIDRRADEDGVVAVQLPAAGLVPPAGHRQYEPIYEAAEDHGLPICMHTHESQGALSFPVQRRWAETFSESHAFIFPAEAIWHLNSLVCNGVPERFPDLQWVHQEPGFEWLPWLMWRLDDHYLQNSDDFPMLTRRPSQIIRDQFHVTTQPLGHTETPQHMGWMLEIAGASDTVLFSSDHPHPDFDPPQEVFEPARSQLDDGALRGLMGETALSVFGLD